jgi:hypothetical protein
MENVAEGGVQFNPKLLLKKRLFNRGASRKFLVRRVQAL